MASNCSINSRHAFLPDNDQYEQPQNDRPSLASSQKRLEGKMGRP